MRLSASLPSETLREGDEKEWSRKGEGGIGEGERERDAR